ncbi:hypothetical protein WJX73_005622 [Symbiochloris irregularis]|uniref:Glycosyl transferase CAP10 domain-containing protein n=1 Tax=Symbiochloris irregularis TaxID=706552 RepID=A0AAW1NPA1_9CHLO
MPQHWHTKRRGTIIALVLCLTLLLLLACLIVPGVWPTHFHKSFSARSWRTSLSLEEQIRSVKRRAGDLRDTLEAEEQAMFEQIDIDLEPYRKGITLEMVEQAYCACRLGGFRFQAIDNELYVAGEVHAPQSRHESIKRQLLDLMRTDGYLPDVDIYFAGMDLPENCTIEEMPAKCSKRGPHFQQNKRREHDWVILHPDSTFGGWPEVKISTWTETQQLMGASANQHHWQDRTPKLFFAGANLGFQRRNFSFVDWTQYPEMDVRWVNWFDPTTLLPLHDFCQFRHLLHMDGCAWSSRLKYLFLCKSAVVFPESPYIEFWYRALTPGRNILSVPEIRSKEDAVQVLHAAQRLLKDGELGRR